MVSPVVHALPSSQLQVLPIDGCLQIPLHLTRPEQHALLLPTFVPALPQQVGELPV